MPNPITPNGTSNCGADGVAQNIFDVLVSDYTFDLPTVDLNGPEFQLPPKTGELFDPPPRITNEELTTGVVGGTGTFDIVMSSMYEHIRTEFDQGRITGDQYAKAYIELTTAGLGNSVQFLLGKDAAYWSAVTAQLAARTAEIQAVLAGVQLEVTKAELAIRLAELQGKEAEYALTKMRLASEDAQFCQIKAQTLNIQTEGLKSEYELANLMPLQKQQGESELAVAQFNLTQMLPTQKLQLIAETEIKEFTLTQIMPQQLLESKAEVEIKEYTVGSMMPAQRAGLVADSMLKEYNLLQLMPLQKAGLIVDNSMKSYNLTAMLPAQKESVDRDNDIKQYQRDNLLPSEFKIKEEQYQTQRAQTVNSRSDGTAVNGLVGMQKLLYTQQIDSYIKDGQYKAAKMFLDGWIVQKTADELLNAPEQLQNTTVNEVLNKMQTVHNLR